MSQGKDRSALYDPSVVVLDMANLESCLESLTTDEIYPVSSQFSLHNNPTSNGSSNQDQDILSDHDSSSNPPTSKLPLLIRERDVKYQFGRVVLYRKLLQSYPYSRPQIWREARADSLPLYRNYIWASLLGIDHDVQKSYSEIDKHSWTPTDRQIEVDIPRCHQVHCNTRERTLTLDILYKKPI